MSKHEPENIHPSASFGDDSEYATCIHCRQEIVLFGVYDDDRGVVFSKDWAIEYKVPSPVNPEVRVTRWNSECLPELTN